LSYCQEKRSRVARFLPLIAFVLSTLETSRLTLNDFANLISPAAGESLELLGQRARQIDPAKVWQGHNGFLPRSKSFQRMHQQLPVLWFFAR
jgi:hypothetical protein